MRALIMRALRNGVRPRGLTPSLAEVLEGNADALVVQLLVVAGQWLTALGASMIKLDHLCNRGGGSAIVERLDFRGRSQVDKPVEIVVGDIVVDRPDVDAARGLVADAEHLR